MAASGEWNWAMNLTPDQWAKSEGYILKQVEKWRSEGKLTDAQVKIIKDNGAYKKTRAKISPTQDKAQSFAVTTVKNNNELPTATLADIVPNGFGDLFGGIGKYATAIIVGMVLLLIIKR